MSDICELCRRAELIQIYEPHGSKRALKVYLCDHCGLVQSLPRIDRAPRSGAAVASTAGRPNMRCHKGLRTGAAIAAIRSHADLNADLQILDVGSHRGSFLQAILDAAPSAAISAVEPDERIADTCGIMERTELG